MWVVRLAFAVVAMTLTVSGCRPSSTPAGGTSAGTSGACFQSDPSDPYTKVSLCLGPPEMPPGAFLLVTDQMVPDAHLVDRCEGAYHAVPGGVVLDARSCHNRTTGMQRGEQSSSHHPVSYQLRASQPSPVEMWLTLRSGSQVQLRRGR